MELMWYEGSLTFYKKKYNLTQRFSKTIESQNISLSMM